MNARTFIKLVIREHKQGWKDSGIPAEAQKWLFQMAKHFHECPFCRHEFDSMEYEEETLADFVRIKLNQLGFMCTGIDDRIVDAFDEMRLARLELMDAEIELFNAKKELDAAELKVRIAGIPPEHDKNDTTRAVYTRQTVKSEFYSRVHDAERAKLEAKCDYDNAREMVRLLELFKRSEE